MSWLTANEVFFMEVVVRDRVDDLRSSIDLTIASVDGAGETSRDVPEADRATRTRRGWTGDVSSRAGGPDMGNLFESAQPSVHAAHPRRAVSPTARLTSWFGTCRESASLMRSGDRERGSR
jgi:hypothetical protein